MFNIYDLISCSVGGTLRTTEYAVYGFPHRKDYSHEMESSSRCNMYSPFSCRLHNFVHSAFVFLRMFRKKHVQKLA